MAKEKEMIGGAYYVGRAFGPIATPFNGEDKLYGGQRLDGASIVSPRYKHCTFANISFKDVRLSDGHFVNCVFIACFFRKTEIRNTNFSSCRFIDCEFPKASFSSCDFRYVRFSGCYIPFAEIEHNLPPEPNLREGLASNLAREAATLGNSVAARAFRLCEVRARESHYWAAIRARSKWYKQHYSGADRVGVAFRATGSVLNRVLFGYGERLWVLLRNYAFATVVLFPLIYYVAQDGLAARPYGAGLVITPVSVLAILEFSLSNSVAGALHSSIEAVGILTRLLAASQIVLSAVWISLLASYMFRWSLRR